MGKISRIRPLIVFFGMIATAYFWLLTQAGGVVLVWHQRCHPMSLYAGACYTYRATID